MTFPISEEDFKKRQKASRAESERLRDLYAKAAAVTPEERARRREEQAATDKANDKRRKEARKNETERKAHVILKSRLRLLRALSSILPDVEQPKLVDALVYYRAYKLLEWTQASKYAKDQKILDQYAIDEPLDEGDVAILVSVLTSAWTWTEVVTEVVTDEVMPLTIHQAFEKVTPICKKYNLNLSNVKGMCGVKRRDK